MDTGTARTTPEVGTDIRLAAVQAVLTGEPLGTVARRFGVEGVLLERWYRQFLTAGAAALANQRPPGRDDAVLRFYSVLSEEIRSPLSALGGWVELLAADAGPGDGAEAAGAARSLLRRLRHLCDDARDSAAVALGHLELRTEPVDLAMVIDTVGAGRGIAVSTPGPVMIDGDRDRLFQIVEALVSVAGEHRGSVEACLRRRSPWAELSVTTTAAIPFDVMQGLFEPFSRPPGTSDGLSLYVCRALAVAHGGQVGAAGDDATTTLWLRLPLSGNPPA